MEVKKKIIMMVERMRGKRKKTKKQSFVDESFPSQFLTLLKKKV